MTAGMIVLAANVILFAFLMWEVLQVMALRRDLTEKARESVRLERELLTRLDQVRLREKRLDKRGKEASE